jgi:hypothetical protein
MGNLIIWILVLASGCGIFLLGLYMGRRRKSSDIEI